MTKESPPKRLLLIDGYAMFYRIHFAFVYNPLKNKKGEETSVIFGFFNALLSLIRQRPFDLIAFILDAKGPTHRHAVYKDYKANRPPMPETLREQIDFIISILESLGLPYVKKPGWEADDIMGTLAKQAESQGMHTELLTSDKDMMQVVTPNITLLRLDRKTNEFIVDDSAKVKEKWDITPDKMVDFLALMGDSSDNIPGVEGIGKKSAAKLLNQYETLEGIYENINQIKGEKMKSKLEASKEQAYLSKKLVTIDCVVEGIPEVCELTFSPIDKVTLLAHLKEKEMYTFIKKLKLESKDDILSLADLKKGADANNGVASKEIGLKEFKRRSVGVDDLREISKKAKSLGHVVFDLETTSLDPIQTDIVAIVFAFTDHCSYYLRLKTKDEDRWQEAYPILKELFENPSIKKIAHNIKFEYAVLKEKKIELAHLFWDTMLAVYLGDANRSHYNLENVVIDYFGVIKKNYKKLQGKLESILDIPHEALEEYTYEDGEFTCRIYMLQQKELEKENIKLLGEIEIPLVPVLAEIERAGVLIDEKHLGHIKEIFRHEVAGLKEKIYALAGETFNIHSTRKLQEILFEKMGMKPLKKTKTGYSTDMSVLEKLGKKHPIAEAVVRYRILSKLISTYLEALPKLIHPQTTRVHTSYNQSVAATGRLSSNNPNLQNIPIKGKEGRDIRSAFIAPKSMVMASFDYSQVELRILAHLSKDKNLLGAYQHNKDIHTQTAEMLFVGEEITTDKRRMAKTMNFSVMYGISAYALSEDIGVSVSEAKAFIDGYFEAYPGVREYIDTCIEEARRQKWVTTYYGRKRYVPSITDTNFSIRSRAERVAFNSIIQGTASDVIKLAMIELHRKKKANDFEGEMVMQVHDELVFYLPKEKLESSAQVIQETMKNVAPFEDVLEVGTSFGENWEK